MLKTLYSRLMNQNKYDQASKLLAEGALMLMGHKKISEGNEIINDLIHLWRQHPSDQMLSESRAELLLQIFCLIPQCDEQNIDDFMRCVLEWISDLKAKHLTNRKCLRQIDARMEAIYRAYGVNLSNMNKHYLASTAFVRTSDHEKMSNLFAKWSQIESNAKERPYFIARIVLQYLAVKNVDGCRAFVNSVCPRNELRGPSAREPLENFCDLLCESIERKSVVLYNVVSKAYLPLIKVEPRLLRLLQRAGNTCLGIPMPKSNGGLMGNLLSMLS